MTMTSEALAPDLYDYDFEKDPAETRIRPRTEAPRRHDGCRELIVRV